MLEGSRKQVFHVLVLFAMVLIFGSATLAKFDQHVQVKMLNDLCLFSIFLISSIIAITVTVTGLPGEVEQKTIYPIVAKPVRRSEFVLGKYFGAMGTVVVGMAIMTAAYMFLQWFYLGHLQAATLYIVLVLLEETALIAAISLCLSTVCSWPLAWFLSVTLVAMGNMKFALYDSLMSKHQNAFNAVTILAIYHLLPNLESFNFKDALVHDLYVPNAYIVQTVIYGFMYTSAALTLAIAGFARKEL